MGAAFNVAAAGVLLAANPAHAEVRTVKATAGQMFDLSEQMVQRGKSDEAERILELLSRDPDPNVRNEARFRRARIARTAGKPEAAAVLLRRILDDKPDATPVRIELAQLLDQIGDADGAWRELRAAQAAGLPPAVARVVDRFSEAIRARRPAGASFEIAVAPDSNINRATRSDTLGTVLGDFQIDKESKARSGTGLALQGQAFRHFSSQSGEQSVLVRATGAANLYAKSDFNDVAFDLAAGPELRLGRNQVNLEIGTTQRWFGQKPVMHAVRIGMTWARPMWRRTHLRLSANAALSDNQFNDLEDGKTYSGGVELEHAFSPTTGAGLHFSVNRESLRDPGYSTTGWRGGLLGWREIGRMTVTAGFDMGKLNADERLLLFPDKRSDKFTKLSFGATMRQVQLRGFSPIARFTMERNRSTIEFYDYKRTRIETGIVRAF